jgi:hypothetical protein
VVCAGSTLLAMHWGSRTALAAGVLATLGLGLGGCGSTGHGVHGRSAHGGSAHGASGDSRASLKPIPVSDGPALSSQAPASLLRGVLPQLGATQSRCAA